ncbi:MAG: ATP-binding cassette domain-containing protein, partial [Gemmatimonadaceae bacterium]|nr:ATP-binding cassette domain-containing protein [Gemmatimonadaceae bacterium]
NLYIYGRYFDLPRRIIRQRSALLLEFAHLTERAKDPVENLSGGMKRRLTIARSLINEPALLLLDEPTTGLDPQARLAVWGLLEEMKARGVTLIVTTHYMEEADRLCDRLAIVDRGKLLAIDTPEALKARAPGGTMIELVLDGSGEVLVADARAVPGVSSAAMRTDDGGNTLRVYSDRGGEVIAALVSIATAHERAIRDIHLAPPSLETLFISLTGRQLT